MREGVDEVCYRVKVGRSGGRGMEYRYEESDEVVLNHLVVEEDGKRVCLRNWEEEEGGEYRLVVEGRSLLGGGWGRGEVVLSVLSSSSSRSSLSQRQEQADCEELWENDPEDLNGIVTYPSGNLYYPAAMRGEGLVVMLKGLTACGETDMSKELIYDEAEITWRFI